MSFKTALIYIAIGTASVALGSLVGTKLSEMINKAKTVPPPAK